MSKVTKIMRQAQTCHYKQEQLLRGKFIKALSHLSLSLRESALRAWDRLIARKYGIKSYWD